MRFEAPARSAVDADVFRHPLFQCLTPAQLALCLAPDWPGIDEMNALWRPPQNRNGMNYRFVLQEALADGRHYESRIDELGLISTRAENWHDLFNAFIWQNMPRIKMALNAGQVEDIEAYGTRQRTRRQSAMTHFDEAGAVLRLDDPAMQAAWDEHDWPAFFARWPQAEADSSLQLWPFGHALLEHALNPDIALVAKALVLKSRDAWSTEAMDRFISGRIRDGQCLQDPQELRPIPLTGIPGWHPEWRSPDFFTRIPCFRPKRAGKHYPMPMTPR